VARDLEVLELRSARDVVAFHRALGPEALARFAGKGPINTDDSASLEFLAPLAVGAHLDLLRDPSFQALREKGLAARDDAVLALASLRGEETTLENAMGGLDLVERAMSENGHEAARPLLRRAIVSALSGARGTRGVAPAEILERSTRLLEVLWSGALSTRRGTDEDERALGTDLRNLAARPSHVGDLMELGKLLVRAHGDREGARKAVAVAFETDPSRPDVREAYGFLERQGK
jgi:hypothetical protein